MSYRDSSGGGTGSHPMNAPLGHTGAGTPLIVTPASPLPTEPNMKFESFDVMSWPAVGYTTLISSGPMTCGTSGSAGFTAGNGARATVTGAGATGTGLGGAATGALGAHAAATAANVAPRSKRLGILVVISGSRSSSREPNCILNTRVTRSACQPISRRIRIVSPIFSRMSSCHLNTSNTSSRTQRCGVLMTA